jgi:hypothetical protein
MKSIHFWSDNLRLTNPETHHNIISWIMCFHVSSTNSKFLNHSSAFSYSPDHNYWNIKYLQSLLAMVFTNSTNTMKKLYAIILIGYEIVKCD